ncbi:MAG: AAA family ATPase [Candidatus Peribacteraceae bacterium]|nr:AAA family ATPase [Candidatus Peribacteraceae bacterium]
MPKPKEIIGHAEHLTELLRDIASGNVAHAYLFAGPRHLGKMTIARWFAQELLSQGLSDEALERVEHDMKRLTHPDLLVLDQLWIEDVCEDWSVIAQTSNAPQEERSKKHAKTDVISIDDIRGLQKRLIETGLRSYRCCIIRSVERLHDEAANALLKILEEPPAHLVFLLTTQSLSALLPTIVSRARVLRFQRVPQRELQPLLEGMADDDARFLSHLAQGAPGIVKQLRSDPEAFRTHRMVHTKALAFWRSRSLKERLQILLPLKERGEEADQLLLHLSLALREQHASSFSREHVAALHELARGLKTNAHREILSGRFLFSVS